MAKVAACQTVTPLLENSTHSFCLADKATVKTRRFSG